MIKIGLIREKKQPVDLRVAFTPKQCVAIEKRFKTIKFYVQPSPHRCHTEEEYTKSGIVIQEDLSDCDYLFGIKEVPVEFIIPNASYFIFSHTFKKQPYNRDKLQFMLANNVRLIDYELLVEADNKRIVGFGRFAGIIGSHNGLLVYGKKTNTYDLKRAIACKDYAELKSLYKKLKLPAIKIVVTGSGRVAKGAEEFLTLIGIKKVNSQEYITQQFDEPVFTVLTSKDLYFHKKTGVYNREDFHQNPFEYGGHFEEYYKTTDIMINAIYWDVRAPRFFTKNDMKKESFHIKVIADISCDVDGSVPATMRTTDKNELVFGYDVKTEKEVPPLLKNTVDIMAVHNLPTELPLDTSSLFGEQLMNKVIPELFVEHSPILAGATIVENGNLTSDYEYLRDYVEA